jgi:DNA polymerase III subunit alpha, Gram-positive type
VLEESLSLEQNCSLEKNLSEEFIVLDIETTGLSKHHDKITELAAVKVRNGEVVDTFQSLVNPERNIPRFITRLTGINNEMVKDSPTVDKVLPYFMDFLGSSMIIAHNATFDHGFISHNVEKHLQQELCNEKVCTRKLSTRLLSHLPSKKLSSLCEYFNIVNDNAHRALDDTKATTELFLILKNILHDNNITNLEDVQKFESWTTAKCRRMLNFVEK